MDAGSFDRWTRGISTAAAARRSLLGGALAVLLAPVLAGDASAGKGGKGGKGNDKKKKDKKKDKKPDCRNGTTRCGDECVDTSSDRFNCGRCGNDCPEIAECIGGLCIACPQFQTRCGDQCVDTTTDVANCGRCGSACPAARPVSTASASAVGRAVRFQGEAPIAARIQAARVAPMAGAVGRTRSVRQMNDAARRTITRVATGSCCPNGTNCCGDGSTCCPGACLGGGLCA